MLTVNTIESSVPRNLPDDLIPLVMNVWNSTNSGLELPQFTKSEKLILRVLLANCGRMFSYAELADLIYPNLRLDRETAAKKFSRPIQQLEKKLDAYHQEHPLHSAFFQLLKQEADSASDKAKGNQRNVKYCGIFQCYRGGKQQPAPMTSIGRDSNFWQWEGSPRDTTGQPIVRKIIPLWDVMEKSDFGHVIPVDDFELFVICRPDDEFALTGFAALHRKEILQAFVFRNRGREIRNGETIRLQRPLEQVDGERFPQFSQLAIMSRYYDYAVTNAMLHELLPGIGEPADSPLYLKMTHPGMNPNSLTTGVKSEALRCALDISATPLAVNVMLIVNDGTTDKFVINVRGERCGENWNQHGPSLSGTISPDPISGRFLTALTPHQEAFIRSTYHIEPGEHDIRRLDLREQIIDMAREELGDGVRNALSDSETTIYIAGYGIGTTNGTGAIQAIVRIGLSPEAVRASLLTSNVWETRDVEFAERDIPGTDPKHSRAWLEIAEPRRTPFLDYGMGMTYRHFRQ